ncbi:unnamed protein product [Clonostachys byssicola]|uniref:Mid2 domain-containing protein n=1 Tax=Clonostachys byssicola TaxID=160290 RepID=A0A9N9U562_9HYPO|nr:unnamed protein product [Clonostachys byssicola]
MTNILLGLFLLIFLRPCSAANTCYFPNGKIASDNFPCDPDAEQSACCGGGLGNVCLSNKLCQSSSGNVVRGACTDKNWESPECAMYCLGANTGGTDLISCSNVTKTDTSFCCDHTTDCCDSGVARFEVLPSRAGTWASWNVASSRYFTVSTSSTRASSSTATATSTTLVSTTSASTSVSSASASSTAISSEGSQNVTSPGLSVGAQVGIGVGVGVGALLVAVIAFLLWKNHKKNQIINDNQVREVSHPPSSSSPWDPSSQSYASSTHPYSHAGPWPPHHHEQQLLYDNGPKELQDQRWNGPVVRAELPAHV